MRKIALILLLLFPLFALAEEFELNKDYKMVLNPQPPADPTPIQVVQFFSYGCPACYTMDPALETWLITKPSDVEFNRIPVIYHKEWYPLAKAYYVAKNLHIANRITPDLFAAIHKDHQDIGNKEALTLFFQKYGISAETFAANYDFSPSIEGQIARGDALMRHYGIIHIPTLVINGTYETSFGMAKGDANRLMKIVDFLIKKAENKS